MLQWIAFKFQRSILNAKRDVWVKTSVQHFRTSTWLVIMIKRRTICRGKYRNNQLTSLVNTTVRAVYFSSSPEATYRGFCWSIVSPLRRCTVGITNAKGWCHPVGDAMHLGRKVIYTELKPPGMILTRAAIISEWHTPWKEHFNELKLSPVYANLLSMKINVYVVLKSN